MIVPATEQLINALGITNQFTINLDERRGKVNDKLFYNDTVEVLDNLVTAVFTAQASVSPLNPAPAVARFLMTNGSHVSRRMSVCTAYLRDEARELVADPNGLSSYDRKLTNEALAHMNALYNCLMESIEEELINDLREFRMKGPHAFAAVAARVHGPTPVIPEQRDGDS